MLNLENKSKFQRDISSNNLTIYPLAIIDDDIYISTIKETIIESEDNNNKIELKDYGLKISNIKESINIKDHRFKISNVTLSLNNYAINNKRLSDLLVDKVNKSVSIYFKTQSCNYISDCLLVYRGIIKRFSHDDTKINLILEDFTDKVIHQDLPKANMGYGGHCLNKDHINKHIPMTYGKVKKAPLMPYLTSASAGDVSNINLIPDDVGDVTNSDRKIVIGGFFTETDNTDSMDFLDEGTINPLMVYKDDYYRVLQNYNPQVDRLQSGDSGYPVPIQYSIDSTSNFIIMNKEYLAGYAQNSTSVSELQTVKVFYPSQIQLLSSEEEVEVDGAGNSSVLNVSPDGGILRAESAIDNIDNPSFLNLEEFQSYAQIPNNQPTIENSLQQIYDFLPEGAYEINMLKPYDTIWDWGIIMPDEEYDESSDDIYNEWLAVLGEIRNRNYWVMAANWLTINSHHFQGRLRLMQSPTSTMIKNDAFLKIIEMGLTNGNEDENFLNNVNISLEYNVGNNTLTENDEGFKFKQSWANACGLTGDEMSSFNDFALGGHGLYTMPEFNYFENNYQSKTEVYVGQFSNSYIPDNVQRIFSGTITGLPCYAPQVIHKINCIEDHENNPTNIKTIYVGQWNETTMGDVELDEGEVWINVFNQEDGINYLYERNDFCSFFPTSQRLKQYFSNNSRGNIKANFSSIWNGVPTNSYIKNGATVEMPEDEGGVSNEEFEDGYGNIMLNWEGTLQSDLFTKVVGGGSWCIYIEEDILAGEVFRKIDESEYIGEYYNNSTLTHYKKGTIIPLTQMDWRTTGSFPNNTVLHGRNWYFDENIVSTYDKNIILKEGSVEAAEERLAIAFSMSDINFKDEISEKTKSFIFGKIKVGIPEPDIAEDGTNFTHNVNSSDEFLLEAIGTSISEVDGDEGLNFYLPSDPPFTATLMQVSGNHEIFTSGGDLHWDSRPSSDITNEENLFTDLFSYEITDWSTPNAFDGISLIYRIRGVNELNALKQIKINTEIYSLGLVQYNIFENVFDDDFYADLYGRANHPEDFVESEELGYFEYKYTEAGTFIEGESLPKILLENPCDIIYHILEKELNQIDSMDRDLWKKARNNTRDIKLAFSTTDKINSKKLFEGIAKSSGIFPRFNNLGGFSFNYISDTYSQPDFKINTDELLNIEFKRTPVENVHTLVNVKYEKDYAENRFKNETGYCDGYDFFGNGENGTDVLLDNLEIPTTAKGYDYSSLGLKREDKILEFESEYIRDRDSARKIRDYIYLLNCNQHTIIKCTLDVKNGILLEVGDIIEFDKLYNGMKAFGEDYTSNNVYRNGQKIYPYFIITSITKSRKDVKIECMQLHKLTAEFQPAKGSISRKSQVGVGEIATMNFDVTQLQPSNHINFEDLSILENIVANNYPYITEKQRFLADITSDNSIDGYDIYILDSIINYFLYGDDVVSNEDDSLEQESNDLSDVNNDGEVNVVDIVNLVNYVLDTDNNENFAADLNEDNFVNVVDIVILVNQILEI